MTELADIQAHIASMDELLDVVGAMRALAGMRLQEAQQALPGIRQYAGSIAAGIGSALRLLPAADPALRGRGTYARRALILCSAEHGFVGGFNERLWEAVVATLQPHDRLYVLGSRGAALVEERGRQVHWIGTMATRVAAAAASIDALTGPLYAQIARGEIGRVESLYARSRQGATPTIQRQVLLPLDTAALAAPRAAQGPLHNLEPSRLLEGLVAEYLFARLMEAAVESMASENAARFAAMEAAHDNVSRKLGELQRSAQQMRQAEITAELLDLIVGGEALAER